ncbi:MAG: hypothetical protein HY298_26650 [Verrucomicrobia bacterium]|nr:hypothetical protein [Verrucomicrobiota bacterium]
MVKKIFYVVLIILAGWLGFLGYQKFFPSEEKRVRLLLADLAEVTSFPANEKPLSRLASANKLAGLFSTDAEINVQVPAEGGRSIHGRDEILQIALAVRSQISGLRVEFLDINVGLDAERQSATAELTAKVTQSGQRDFGVQELKIQLKKIDGTWRITHVDTVRTLGP